MHEDWRGSILQDISITKVTECYTCAESQHSRKDPPNPDARESNDNESEKRLHRGTCRGNIDFRIPGIPHSTVEQMDTNREETVKR